MDKRITIVTIVRNAEVALDRTVNNVLSQKARNQLEYIVIDGASNDNTRLVLDKYKNEFDDYISEPDKGIYDAMNKGIAKSTAPWIHFLNAGDLYDSPSFWQEKLPLLDNNEALYFVPVKLTVNNMVVRNLNPKKFMFLGMPYSHQGLLMPRKAFGSIGTFDPNYRICADYDWLLRFFINRNLSLRDIRLLNGCSVLYDNTGLSSQLYRKRENEGLSIIAKYYGKGLRYSTFYLWSSLKSLIKDYGFHKKSSQ